MLNFAEQTGSGAVIVVWSFLQKVMRYSYINYILWRRGQSLFRGVLAWIRAWHVTLYLWQTISRSYLSLLPQLGSPIARAWKIIFYDLFFHHPFKFLRFIFSSLVTPLVGFSERGTNEKKNVFIKIVTPLAKLCRIVWSGTFITNTLVWVIAEPGQLPILWYG